MPFNSLLFILFFLPVSAGLLVILPARTSNICLLLISLLFYALGETVLVLLLLLMALFNFGAGFLIARDRKKGYLVAAILFNLLPLVFFKYLDFLASVVHSFAGHRPAVLLLPAVLQNLVLPLGISFFTFRAISYLVDVYRRKTPPCTNLVGFLLFFSLFPLVTAGPLMRYNEMRDEMSARTLTGSGFLDGLRRFIAGLAKKVLIAGAFKTIADAVFAAETGQLSMGVAWLGILAFSFEIFFDFSGYTDMAIGTGRMFGFRFRENFNHPYAAKNVQDFWKRWHITLSEWLRDYLFLPLSFFLSRHMPKEKYFSIRTDRIIYSLAILVTFFICGMWHGAGWNYIAWGVYFALFLIIEQMGLRRGLKRTYPLVGHLYAVVIIAIGWVFFRSPDMAAAFRYLERMFSFSGGEGSLNSLLIFYSINRETVLMTIFALLLSFPAINSAGRIMRQLLPKPVHPIMAHVKTPVNIIWQLILLIASLGYISAGFYQPFLYKQF